MPEESDYEGTPAEQEEHAERVRQTPMRWAYEDDNTDDEQRSRS